MENFDIKAIVEYLSPFKDKLINGDLYNWNNMNFKETIEIRKYLGGKLKDAQQNNDFPAFFEACKEVLKWGGIKSGDEEKLKKMVKKIFNNEELKDFDRIASTSKVASFLDPNEYIIYDSRVSYSINWILLDKCNSNFYFRMPSGRNAKLKDDMDKLEKLIRSKYNYEEDTYKTVNKLVKKVHEKLWGGEYHELYYTEMILFAIATNIA